MREKFGRLTMSLSQILILVIGIVAISYAIGSSLGEVNGAADTSGTTQFKEEEDPGKFNPDATTTSLAIPIVGRLFGINSKTGGIGMTGKLLTKPDITNSGTNIIKDTASKPKFTHQIGDTVVWAGAIYLGIQLLGPLFLNDKKTINAASAALAIGFSVGKTLKDLGWLKGKVLGTLPGFVFVGIGAAVIVLSLFKKTSEQRITFTCQSWDAQTGGKYCTECGKDGLPCTEYQCESLGQGCELINQGTEDVGCVWKNEKDILPPVIQPSYNSLLSKDYTYTPDNTISPPNRGVYIKYQGGCIPAFTPFDFGITIVGGGINNQPEPAICKIDTEKKDSFDAMQYYFGGSSTAKYNHTQTVSLPSPESLAAENITLQNDGNYELHVRCQDTNGRPDVADFVFKYCVDKGPDTTAPVIVGTSILNNLPIAYNQSEVNLEVYINEPADCRWNHNIDADFASMTGTMKCSSSVFEMNAQMLYKCSANLTGLQGLEENKFYFRCKDKPLSAESERNSNSEGYLFTIVGTQPLVIDSVGPEGIVKDSSTSIKVTLTAETSAGYKEGEATCYYSESCYKETGITDKFDTFYYPQGKSSYSHSQDIWVPEGEYECHIKCIDLGGNTDEESFGFTAESDTTAPVVVRAYRDGSYLRIITNEKAECVYGIQTCSYLFTDGLEMNNYNQTEHYVDWNPARTYYIKCQDQYSRQPMPDACSIIVRPTGDST